MTKEARDWQTCVHEIGHAAAALLLGIPGVGAAVFTAGGGMATTTPHTATPAKAEDYTPLALDSLYRFDEWPALLRNATFTAAGQAAVDLALHPELTETTVAGHDAAMLHAAARAAVPLYSDPYLELAFADMAAARARTLLKPILWRVKLGAKALQSKRRMTAEEIVSAMYPEFTNDSRRAS